MTARQLLLLDLTKAQVSGHRCEAAICLGYLLESSAVGKSFLILYSGCFEIMK